MSEENVETSKRFLAALTRRDYEAAAQEIGPDFEINDNDIPESTSSDSLFTWLARWDDTWEDWRFDDLEIRPVGDDRTVHLFTMVVKGKGSGIELSRRDAHVAEFRNGKMVCISYYNDQDEALQAARASS
jgi:ketosteroid isomerase-like protein